MLETAATFVSVLVVNSILADGKSNWLEGGMLLGSYVILALAFLQLWVMKVQINSKFGIGLIITALLLSIVGTIGFTIEDSVESYQLQMCPTRYFLLMIPFNQIL